MEYLTATNVVLLGGVVALGLVVRSKLATPSYVCDPQPTKGDPAETNITLYQIGRGGDLVGSASPFCLKLETFLRLSGLSHKVEDGIPVNAPKGKMPYITHGDTVVADSSLIVTYLQNTFGATFGGKMNVTTDPREAAVEVATKRMVENHLYWILLYSRWIDDDGYAFTRGSFVGMPWPLSALIPRVVRNAMFQSIWAAGAARHAQEDRVRFVQQDLAALSAILGHKAFFGGDKPSALDATTFGTLEQMENGVQTSWVTPLVRAHPNLVKYVRRVRNTYFADRIGRASAAGADESKES